MSEMITVPFSHLVLRHREIGIHRGRRWGFRDVFDFPTLRDVPFVTLASRVKDAYEGRDVPSHCGWSAQREALRWLVEKGHDGIYALDEQGIKLMDSRPGALDEQGIKLTDRRPDALGEQGIKLMDSRTPALDEQRIKRVVNSAPDAFDEEGIKRIMSGPDALEEIKLDSTRGALEEPKLAGSPDRYYISDGHHRALALYVLGEGEVRARIFSKDEVRARAEI